MDNRSAVPYIVLALMTLSSALAVLVFRRFGRQALWLNAAFEGASLLAFLFAVGWAYSHESPLWITILAVVATVVVIAGVVQGLGPRSPALAIIVGGVVGAVTAYAGLLAGYVLMLYMG